LHLLLFSFSFFIFRFPILVLSFKVIWMCYGLKFRSFPISPWCRRSKQLADHDQECCRW
jgi:hypothetical protein